MNAEIIRVCVPVCISNLDFLQHQHQTGREGELGYRECSALWSPVLLPSETTIQCLCVPKASAPIPPAHFAFSPGHMIHAALNQSNSQQVFLVSLAPSALTSFQQ